MGWAVSFAVRGVVSYFFIETRKWRTSIPLLLFSALIHFSMFYVIAIFIASNFIKISKKLLPVCLVLSLVFGKTIIPIVLGKFGFGGLSEYALDGYINNSTFANQGDSTHEFIVYAYYYLVVAAMTVYYFLFSDRKDHKYTNFLCIYISSCFLLSSFYVAFNRYFVETGVYFYIVGIASMNDIYIKRAKYLILLLAVFNLSFANIYLQRRPILFGNMWVSLFKPPVLYAFRTEKDFEDKLQYVNLDGNWIGHDIQ